MHCLSVLFWAYCVVIACFDQIKFQVNSPLSLPETKTKKLAKLIFYHLRAKELILIFSILETSAAQQKVFVENLNFSHVLIYLLPQLLLESSSKMSPTPTVLSWCTQLYTLKLLWKSINGLYCFERTLYFLSPFNKK